MQVITNLSQTAFDVTSIDAQFRQSVSASGAIVTFSGIMRPLSKSGEPLDALILEWHPTMTEKSIASIGQTGFERFNVNNIHITHRCGTIHPNEPIVFVGVASDHRREAFQAADYLMDRLKTDAVFWKREEGAFGSRWIETTSRDKSDRKRWDNENERPSP